MGNEGRSGGPQGSKSTRSSEEPIHLTATSRVLKSLTSTVGFRGWVAVCGSGNEMDSLLTFFPCRKGTPALRHVHQLSSGCKIGSDLPGDLAGQREQQAHGLVPGVGGGVEHQRAAPVDHGDAMLP